MARKTRTKSKTNAEHVKDMCNEVTRAILDELEKGARPWRCPWEAPLVYEPPRRWNGIKYKGVNVVVLWLTAQHRGYRNPFWMTFRQSKLLGGSVRKGEKSVRIVKVGSTLRPETEPGGEAELFTWLKTYRVFNVEQISGLPAHYYREPVPPMDFGTEADQRLLDWIARTGIRFESSDVSGQAYYDALTDSVTLPPANTFQSSESWAGVLLHEATHATGHSARLNRDMGIFGSDAYAREELVAEIGSAMVSARLGIKPDFPQNAAYLASWTKILKEDQRAVLRASTKAQEAADWLMLKGGMLDGSPELEVLDEGIDDLDFGESLAVQRRPERERERTPVLDDSDVLEPYRVPEQLDLF